MLKKIFIIGSIIILILNFILLAFNRSPIWLFIFLVSLFLLIVIGMILFQESSTRTWVPIIISALAFFVSIFNLYQTWLLPFSLEVAVNRSIFYRGHPPKDPAKFVVVPFFPISLINKGAIGGMVNNMYISLATGDYKWVLGPDFFYSEFGQKAVTEKEPPEAFHPIYIPGGKEIFKIIRFGSVIDVSLNYPIFSGSKDPLPSGEYIIEFYLSYGKNPKLRLVKTMKIKLDPKIAGKISEGSDIIVLYESDIGQESARFLSGFIK